MYFPRSLPSRTDFGVFNYTPTKVEFKAMKKLGFKCDCCGFIGQPTKAHPACGLEFLRVAGQIKLLCILCAQSQMLMRPVMLENGNKEYNHGRLIYCPEISQGKIIRVVRDIFAMAQYQKSNPNRPMRRYIEELRESFIESLLSRCTNIPALKVSNNDLVGYASLYKYASPELLKNEKKVFGSIRYLPDEVVYGQQIKQWLHTSYQPYLNEV
ncbi:hypothetical protein [Pseudoalteromonas nigrifaciens]|uniref:hypothetical protein n=1 Tax=Pseudoalteromonas nigrifaciens TaxID=28109 RepID=UPI003FD17F49